MQVSPHPSLGPTAHRSYPPPAELWRQTQRWSDLLFAHWPVPVDEMARHLPAGLVPDVYDGYAWLGVVPFSMSRVRVRAVGERHLWVPGAESFPELNLRTYVRPAGQPESPGGVYFFSLDAASLLAVIGARVLFGLPYFWAAMRSKQLADGGIRYTSRRLVGPTAGFEASYRAAGPVELSEPGSLAAFLTERYRLYTARGARVAVGEIHHPQWPLQAAEAEIVRNELPRSFGFAPQGTPVLHFARELDVHIWGLRRWG